MLQKGLCVLAPIIVSAVVMTGCKESTWNNPYPAEQATANILYSSFSARPKHLDPAQSYSSNEIVFTGVDVTSYGSDLPGQPTLGQMIRRVLALVPELPRLRLSSLDPVEIDDDLWRLIAEEPRLMPHLHMSLQAGDDMVLKRMKRGYTVDDYRAMMARIDETLGEAAAVSSDFIVGFCGETEEEFQDTVKLVEECRFKNSFIFF